MKKIRELIKSKKIVSFDIYETLIQRLVNNPHKIFEIVDRLYVDRYGSESGLGGFVEKRINAERKARFDKNGMEIVLEDIYSLIEKECSEEVSKRYRDLEIEVETRLCCVNQELLEVVNMCLADRKRVIIVSDMYLSKKNIEDILHKCGLVNYSRLYVSSDYGVSKQTGELFSIVIREENVEPSDILHIGDNFRSDYLRAREKGIKAFWYKGKERKFCDNNIDLEILNNQIILKKKKGFFFDLGYKSFGPMLYGFVHWIISECGREGIDKVLFLARDGYLMKEVFDLINDSSRIKSEYFYASRKALNVPLLQFCNSFRDVLDTMFFPRQFSTNWIMNKWGVAYETFADEIEAMGIDRFTIFYKSDLYNDTRLEKLFCTLKDNIYENSCKEYERLGKYIKTFELKEKTAVIDIGWHGNMQKSLDLILHRLGISSVLYGYYIGVVPDSCIQLDHHMKGYLYQKDKQEGLYKKLKYVNTLLEIFFMAPHGTTDGYDEIDGESKARLLKNEYSFTKTESYVLALQQGAVEFVKDYYRSCEGIIRDYSERFLDNFYSSLLRPDMLTAKMLGELTQYEDGWIKMAPKSKLVPKVIINDFLMSPWKIGYMKRLIGLPLRYDKIVVLLRENFRKFFE